jgi:hypothetical protein
MPDDHSNLVPLLPIPNRTVKRVCADDSADSRVKVGHRQALTAPNTPSYISYLGVLVFMGFGDSVVVNPIAITAQGLRSFQVIDQAVQPDRCLCCTDRHVTSHVRG